MTDQKIFDMLFESMTRNWDADLRAKCVNDYVVFRNECENFENILKNVVENEDLKQQVQNEIKKRLRT